MASRRVRDNFGRLLPVKKKVSRDLDIIKRWIEDQRKTDHRQLTPESGQTLEQWYEFLRTNEWPIKLADQTIGLKEGRWKNHCQSYLGHLRLDRIDKMKVRSWLKELEDRGVGLPTITECRRDLHSMFETAVEVYEILDKNPCRKIATKESGPRTRTSVSPELAKTVIQTAFDKRAKYDHQPRPGEVPGWIIGMVATAFYAGLRKGELQALTWEQIDRDRRVITVNRAVRRDRSGRLSVGLPKCDKSRQIPITDELLRIIEATTTTREGLVWPTDAKRGFRDGAPVVNVKPTCKVNHWFIQLRDNCGLPGTMVFRDTRSTFATWLNQLSLGPVTITEILGHESIRTTRTHYVDVNDPAIIDAREKFAALVA
ncbi:MAG: site-specific integrase [Armatimonadetes bacterium]|nr:site-specific integrase [Armatimonadota bacterium]